MFRKLLPALGLLLSTAAFASAQAPDTTDYRILGASMPQLRVVTDSGKVFTGNDAPAGDNLFVMLFNPTCDHCQEATRLLGKNQTLFKDGQLLVAAAPGMMLHLEFFNNVTHYKNFPVLKVGVDSAQFIDKTYNYQMLPQINIYDRNRRLVRFFTGDIALDSLKPYLGPAARQFSSGAPGKSALPKRKRGR